MVKYTCKGQSRFQYYQYVTRFLTNTSHYRIFNFFSSSLYAIGPKSSQNKLKFYASLYQ